MLKNYFTVALRNLKKHKAFSFINIVGLAVGLTCCMLITLYIYHEYSFDTYHEKKERLYQLGAVFSGGDEARRGATVPSAMGDALMREFPEIEERAKLLSLFRDDKTLLQYEAPGAELKSFYENKGYIADPSFFRLFTYDFVEGNPATALTNPNTVVVTEAIAKKLFGTEPALNKVIRISSSTNGDHTVTIAGVFRPKAVPSHIDAQFLLSPLGGNMQEYFMNGTTLVNNNMFFTYLLLKEGADARQLEQKFPAFVERHMGEALRETQQKRALFLTNVEDIHLHSGIEENVTPSGSLPYLRILASIAVLTLLIACINFMNLSTARSSKRSVEVGVRKVLGAEKQALIWQFLGESLIMALIAFVLALSATQLLLPLFEQVSGRDIALSLQQHGVLLLAFVGLALLTGLLAGSYPAFYLSSFKPVRVLKGRYSSSLAAVSLRKGLVIFQFVISVVLVIASVIISDQMRFLRNKDLGFVKDQQLVIPLRSQTAKNNSAAMKNALSSNPNVQSVGASFYYPGIFNPTDWLMYKQGNSMQQAKSVYINWVDDSFLQTLGIKPVAGRLFSPQFPADTNSHIILNQKGVAEMGFATPEEALGSWIAFDWNGQVNRFTIVGVVEDFHFKDLRMPIESFGFLLNNSANQSYLIAHLSGDSMGNTLEAIEKAWNGLNPNQPFEYSFLDQDFQKNYLAESRLADMIRYFTIVAILISCLGLFGLATFSAEQRIKEIGIRKVLGASVASLAALLSVDFLKLILIALVLASPIAWYIMSEWLQGFAYRVSIGWQVFALTFVLAMLIALLTVSFQAIKAALANPVQNLRTE
ncbi:ABC transporter permease [Cesiribacter andamanensis]|uniref:Macrolide export ATP-binding/permease protein MacB n=1 Tax=Cesiribacter andamanensis AMV16 TaxID=1279009 RepID=M7NLX3_9BACT|nr:ABC transporter permease [Cesiribacter andamanensis]EMR02755.1 Macrolide export ATP-binding/permease protein MacB [Cesiribacter andamanensis AMV16]